MTNIMSTTVRYALVALLTFAATFGYFKYTGKKTPVDPPKKDKVKTYPITQFFQFHTLSLIDSVAFLKEQKQNIAFLGNLIESQNVLYNDFGTLSPCGGDIDQASCAFVLAIGCRPCAPCCSGRLLNPLYDPIERNILADITMNPHFFFGEKEVQLPSTTVKNLQVFNLSKDIRIDRMEATFAGQQHQLSIQPR
jgi:hypothetical protein